MNGETRSDTTLSSVNPSIEDYRESYKLADQFCQKVQDFVSEAGIPAMNELRNAGHHFLRSVDDGGNLKSPAELIKAINHTKRACYEAGEAGVLIALDDIKSFRDDFRNVQVVTVIPNYIELMTRAEIARESVLAVRTDDEDRSNDYALRMDAFSELREICRTLAAARSECVKLIHSEQASSRRFIMELFLTILGIVVTIALAVVGWAYFTD